MKKTVSVILSVAILVVSLFSINAFAAETTKTEALLDKINSSREVSVTLRTGKGNEYGVDHGVSTTIYAEDNELAFDLTNKYVTMRAVVAKGNIIGFLPSFPYIYLKTLSPFITSDGMWGAISRLSNLTMDFLYFVDSYSETVDGTEYYVEEFNDRDDVTNKFYYIGDDLKMLRVENVKKKTVQYTYFDSISFDVDDSVFATPVFAIDLTPLVKLLFASLLTTLMPA